MSKVTCPKCGTEVSDLNTELLLAAKRLLANEVLKGSDNYVEALCELREIVKNVEDQ